ncbi:hypothetical protein AAG906_039967 [Vitis piasezkii]
MKDSQPRNSCFTQKLCTPGMQVLPLMQMQNGLEKHQCPLVVNNEKKTQTLLEFHRKDNGRQRPLKRNTSKFHQERLDDMLTTPFSSRIINYEPPRGFIVPKFSTYDGSSDPFDHIMHYRQLMTLDIGNDMLLCKVCPASLQGQALSWFHRLPVNSVDNLRTRPSFPVLQVESYNMDVVLQIFKRSICPGTPFFESLAKKPPTTMDDLFRRANKYSMLEDDVTTRNNTARTCALSQQGPSNRGRRTNKIKSHGKRSQQKSIVRRQKREPSRDHGPRVPITPIRVVINYIHGGPSMKNTTLKGKDKDWIGDFDVKRILVDPGSSADLLQVSVVKQMGFIPSSLENLGRMLSRFNDASTTSLDLSPFNAILGRTWLHNMKVIPSTYHQMVSFITHDGQVDLYGSQLTARQCYQVAREVGPSANCEHSSKETSPSNQ